MSMMTKLPDETLTPRLLAAVRQAGAAIMRFYLPDNGSLAVRQKKDCSPVTAADLAAHHVLVEQLAAITPELPVVSEEDEASVQTRLQHARYWLIDPLDGTREFISHSGEFTVNLALIDGQTAVWGCVHAPALDLLYWGGQGMGAFRCAQGSVSALHTAPPSEPGGPYRVVASKSHLDDQTQQFIDRLGSTRLVQAGSSLKFCRIAEGEADIYPRMGPTCEWDTAAAQAVLEAAGGVVCDLRGQPLRYSKADILNPGFVAARNGMQWT